MCYNKTILIWIIFQLGPLGALFAQGNWQNFTTENTIMTDNQINDILIIDGVKWIGTNWGLYTYDNTSWIDYTDVLPHPLVNSISIDQEGNIYVCTLSGIAIYDGVSWETITSQNSIITNHVNEVIFDDNNTAYVGTIDGLFKMNNDDISIILDSSSLEPNFINVRCLTFKGDSLCIGTVNGGLGYLYNDSISWYNTNNGLIDNTSTDLLVDKENLWITSPYGGLISHLLDANFLIFNTSFFSDWPSNSLNTVYKDDELFYVGSSGGGFFSFSYDFGVQNTNTFNTKNSGLINDYVLCIEKDELGYWIGTEGGLVYWTDISSIYEPYQVIKPVNNIFDNVLTFHFKDDINIYSLDGKLIFSDNNISSINLSFLNKGVYISEFNNSRSILILH
ncbi:MAG: hypothetical protein CMP70_01650 [Flavobacteriales bacterium]|nr:hypothetical protein [Flavobacteriales bacterium]